MPLQTAKDALDGTTYLGGGVAGGGLLVSITDWAPVVGIAISSIVGLLTIVHLINRIRISNQELIMNRQEMNSRKDDPKD